MGLPAHFSLRQATREENWIYRSNFTDITDRHESMEKKGKKVINPPHLKDFSTRLLLLLLLVA